MVWAPDYVTLAELKKFVRVGDAVDDAELTLIASAASRAVDTAAGRQFGSVPAPEERSYPVTYSRRRGRWIAAVDDVQTAVGAVFPAGVDPPTLEPRNAVVVGLAWTRAVWTADPSGGTGEVALSMRWGWLVTPAAVPLATRLQGSRWVARRDSPFGVAGSPQDGSELRLLARADPDVAVSLEYYRRDWWAQ